MTFKVEYLLQDSSILLPPTGTPMTGIEFTKRLPCGEVRHFLSLIWTWLILNDVKSIEIPQVERARRAIRVFLLMRRLTLAINGQEETQLPLVRAEHCIKVSDVLDLSNFTCVLLFPNWYRTTGCWFVDVIHLTIAGNATSAASLRYRGPKGFFSGFFCNSFIRWTIEFMKKS